MHMKLYTYMYSVLCTHNIIVPTKVHIHTVLAIMETSAPIQQIVCFQEVAAAARVCTLGHYRK